MGSPFIVRTDVILALEKGSGFKIPLYPDPGQITLIEAEGV